MALKTSFPAPTTVAISSADSRADLAALVVRTTAGVPRAGIMPRTTAAVVTSRASMGVDVTAFEAVVVRNGLPAFIDNDGSVTVSGLAAPGANSWYSILYVKQNETESPFSDANNNPVFGFVTGTAAAIPDLAAAVALVPAGGLALASVLIPSTAVTTQSAGVVINQIAPFTTTTGGPIWARTKADLDLITGFAAGQTGYTIDTGSTYTMRGSGWFGVQHAEFTFDRTAVADGTIVLFTTAVDAANTNDAIASVPGASSQTITIRDAGVYAISWFVTFSAAATGQGNIDITGASLLARGYMAVGQNAHTLNQDNLYLPAGQVITFSVLKTTGSTSNIVSRIRLTKLGAF